MRLDKLRAGAALVAVAFCLFPVAAGAQADPPVTLTPTSGPVGTRIEVSGGGCNQSTVSVFLVRNFDTDDEDDVAEVPDVPVQGGNWRTAVTVPPGVRDGEKLHIDAVCGDPNSANAMEYDIERAVFTVTAGTAATDPGGTNGTNGPATTVRQGATTPATAAQLGQRGSTTTTAAGGGAAGNATTTTRTTGSPGTTGAGGATTTTTRTSATTATTARTSTTRTTTRQAAFARTGASGVRWAATGVALLAAGQCLMLLRLRPER